MLKNSAGKRAALALIYTHLYSQGVHRCVDDKNLRQLCFMSSTWKDEFAAIIRFAPLKLAVDRILASMHEIFANAYSHIGGPAFRRSGCSRRYC